MASVDDAGELEVMTAPDRIVWSASGGYLGPALRVRYRVAGERRWSSFLLIPKDGQTLEDLADFAAEAAAAHRVATVEEL